MVNVVYLETPSWRVRLGASLIDITRLAVV